MSRTCFSFLAFHLEYPDSPRLLSFLCSNRSRESLCIQNIPRPIQWNRFIRTFYSTLFVHVHPTPSLLPSNKDLSTRLSYNLIACILSFSIFHCFCISSVVASSVVVRCSLMDLGISFVFVFEANGRYRGRVWWLSGWDESGPTDGACTSPSPFPSLQRTLT